MYGTSLFIQLLQALFLFVIIKVRMVSQGAQTNGMNGKKLSKSFSEMGTADAGCQYEEEG